MNTINNHCSDDVALKKFNQITRHLIIKKQIWIYEKNKQRDHWLNSTAELVSINCYKIFRRWCAQINMTFHPWGSRIECCSHQFRSAAPPCGQISINSIQLTEKLRFLLSFERLKTGWKHLCLFIALTENFRVYHRLTALFPNGHRIQSAKIANKNSFSKEFCN